MDTDAIREEVHRTVALYKEHEKYLKKLELKAAKFGIHTPIPLDVELEDTKEKMRICKRRLELLADGNHTLVKLFKAVDLLVFVLEELKDFMTFANPADHMVDAEGVQESGVEIAGLILEVDNINKEYSELTKSYSDLL